MTTATTAEVRRGNKERKRVRLGCDIPFVVHRLGFPVDLRIRSFGERRPLQRQRAEAKLDRGKAAEVVLTRYSGATGEGTTVIRNMRYFAATCTLPEKRAPIAQGGRDARKAYVPGGHSRRDRECRNCPLRSGPRRPRGGQDKDVRAAARRLARRLVLESRCRAVACGGPPGVHADPDWPGRALPPDFEEHHTDVFVQDLVNVFEWEDLNDVILVGHSFGGIASTGAADRIPKRIRHIVFQHSGESADSGR
jgi:hypothetical protein